MNVLVELVVDIVKVFECFVGLRVMADKQVLPSPN
jgi:hypothetical protein